MQALQEIKAQYTDLCTKIGDMEIQLKLFRDEAFRVNELYVKEYLKTLDDKKEVTDGTTISKTI